MSSEQNNDSPNTILGRAGSVAIIGCTGRMGAMLMREGRDASLGLIGVDQPLAPAVLHNALSKARLALVCVPANVFGDVLRTIIPYLPPDAILADITSVKLNPMQEMEALWPGLVVGTHPLFGPSPDRSSDLPVVLVPGTKCSDDSLKLVEAFFHAMRFTTFTATAQEHDRAMARIQNMNFITQLAFFAMLAENDSLTPYITPSFRRRVASAKKMLTEDGPMFAGLFEANPYSQEAVRQFSKFLSLASAGDIDLLLNRADWWWRDNNRS